MKILLVGKGHMGQFLRDEFKVPPELFWTDDLEKLTTAKLEEIKPDAVINTAAKTDLPWVESNKDEAFRCNVIAPLNLYRAIKRMNGARIPLIHFSSGCIWDGPYDVDGKPFKPDSPPTPACWYSWTKAMCDSMMLQEAMGPLQILRPRQVYSSSSSPRNTLVKLNGYQKLLDMPNSMTSLATIAKTIRAILDTQVKFFVRVMNVYDVGYSTPYQVGMKLAAAGCRHAPKRVEKAELDGWHKPKRVDAVIEDKFFEGLVLPPPVDAELDRNIKIFAAEFKKNRVVPFKDGGPQAVAWQEYNCEKCKKGHVFLKKFPFPCQIEDALFITANSTEDVSEDVAKRMGYFGNENNPEAWRCSEFESIE